VQDKDIERNQLGFDKIDEEIKANGHYQPKFHMEATGKITYK